MLRVHHESRLLTSGPTADTAVGHGPVALGLSAGVLNASFGGAVHPDDAVVVSQLVANAEQRGHAPVLIRWLMPTGELRYFEVVVMATCAAQYTVHGWEVTAHVRQQQVLEHLALHDPLTGLANRVLFEERVGEEVRRRARTSQNVAVLYADLDGFKQINDTWGHAAGDILLTTLADRLRQSVRPGDVVARIGGDEFAICCPDLAGLDDALAVANRVIDDVTKPVPIGSSLVRVSVTIGVATAESDDTTDGTRLMARADLAMYAAKNAGRGRVAVAPPPSAGASERYSDEGVRDASSVAQIPPSVGRRAAWPVDRASRLTPPKHVRWRLDGWTSSRSSCSARSRSATFVSFGSGSPTSWAF